MQNVQVTTSPDKAGFCAASMRLMHGITLACLTLLSAACSNRALYESIQQNGLQECEKLPIPQQAQCKSQYQTDYDEYRRERDRIGAKE